MFEQNNNFFSKQLCLSATLTVAGLALVLTGNPLIAAEPAAAPDSSSSEQTNGPTRLPPVTVLSQKQPAALESLPISVSAVTADTIRQDAIHDVKAAELYAPNVFINQFTARKLSDPFIRGIGASPNNPGVTTYIDGVPQLNGNSSNIELVDVNQIEFVRGPQGALFGRNTAGGLINITSRRPSPVWNSELDGEFGNHDYRRIQLTLSGPIISEQLGISLGGGYSARSGFTINDVTGHSLDDREALFGKAQLLWNPAPDWDLRLILFGERDRDGDYALGDLAAIRERPHHVAHDFEGYTHRDIIAPTLLAHHYGSQVDFDSATGLLWWKTHDLTDLDYTPIPAVTRDNSEKAFQFTEEFRLSSAKEAPLQLADELQLRWQAGFSVFTQNYDQDALNNYAPGILYQPNQYGPGIPPFASPANTRHAPQSSLDTWGLGAFAQATLTAWEKFDVTVGARGDYEREDADLNTFFSTPDFFLGPPTHISDSRDFCEGSPQVSLAFRPTSHQTLYATVGRGYKAGGFNPISPPGYESYGEEYNWNYEVGAKTTWLEDRLSVNLALFYIDWENLQLNQPSGAPGQFYIANAGSADSKGVEVEVRARPLSGWDLFAGAAYTDARFQSGATAGHTDAFGNDSLVGVGGNHLIYTPDFTANAGMQYSLAVCRQATLYARAEVVAYGRYFYNPANTAYQDAYALANFRAGVRGNHWYAEGWVRNAFDSQYVPIAFEFPNGAFGGSGFVGENGAPVTYGLRAGLTF